MKKKMLKNAKVIITVVIVFCFVWFLIIFPMITFHNNEKTLEAAAKRYFELNSGELPTGERIKTVGLNTLYHQSYLKNDLYIPYTHKTCSIENSWVKVRKENNEYKYYTYLECGVLNSSIDHKGPEIKLEGDEEITVGRGEDFEDPGVKSVVDNVDGKMKTSEVTVKSNVDTTTVGTYEVVYTAYDSLSNKSTVTRTVQVVQKLYGTVKSELGDAKNFVGNPTDNYVRLSNMMYRIYGVDSNKNVIIVADEDIANVNYTKLDEWLKYYYENLNETTKKMIVESKYCDMEVSETALDTTECTSTVKKKVSVPSIIEVNRAASGSANFMKPYTMSWVMNAKDSKEAYVTRNVFFGSEEGKDYLAYSVDDNYGVRPMMTVRGDALITGGIGTEDNPFVFGDTKKAKGGDKVNERATGEYISIDGSIYRIIGVQKDETTKVISESTVGSYTDSITCQANPGENTITYDPKDSDSVAYYINNKVSEYVDTTYFVNHEIEVPIYKNKIVYGEEASKKTYKVVLSAPDMYEIFSAQPQHGETLSYWLINTSKAERVTGAIYDIGVPYNEPVGDYDELHLRVVGYLKKSATISSGSGTFKDPYIIK